MAVGDETSTQRMRLHGPYVNTDDQADPKNSATIISQLKSLASHLITWIVGLICGLVVAFVSGLPSAAVNWYFGHSAETTSQMVNRAYITRVWARAVSFNKQGPSEVEIVTANDGKTLAFDAAIQATGWSSGLRAPTATPDGAIETNSGERNAHPNGTLAFKVPITELAKGKNGAVHLRGLIRYKDAYEQPHITHFYFIRVGNSKSTLMRLETLAGSDDWSTN